MQICWIYCCHTVTKYKNRNCIITLHFVERLILFGRFVASLKECNE